MASMSVSRHRVTFRAAFQALKQNYNKKETNFLGTCHGD